MLKRILLLLVLVTHAAVAAAEGIEVRRASVDLGDEGYVVNADFDIELRPRQEEAIDKGLSLYFWLNLKPPARAGTGWTKKSFHNNNGCALPTSR